MSSGRAPARRPGRPWQRPRSRSPGSRSGPGPTHCRDRFPGQPRRPRAPRSPSGTGRGRERRCAACRSPWGAPTPCRTPSPSAGRSSRSGGRGCGAAAASWTSRPRWSTTRAAGRWCRCSARPRSPGSRWWCSSTPRCP
ncbi:hypothetical protein DTW94_01995 [Streptomyces cavourensis]|uniref:Uncharacterized protein n=1 Tax=Streptomyces cavourensis TaxID=67258 RepID=A0AAD0VCY1_9ACTN|nr:hypothetical protein DTW94_01995 [Streptomyces cavourensis]